jgi:hypothetical protein
MPRPGPRRGLVALKLSAEGRHAVEELAAKETGGNLSEMIRKLLSEAMAARNAHR